MTKNIIKNIRSEKENTESFLSLRDKIDDHEYLTICEEEGTLMQEILKDEEGEEVEKKMSCERLENIKYNEEDTTIQNPYIFEK
mmetsp:Transcript_4023/g.3364  ORF Transcript_4023/g.3364 Transcript_4023/m.3364 type:complete len:84 (-) Transcript_4023:930-1181(-)